MFLRYPARLHSVYTPYSSVDTTKRLRRNHDLVAMPRAGTAEQTPEIHSIANLSPVSPSPVHTTTVSALPALQNQADYFGSDPADQARAIAMAHIQAEHSRTDANVGTAEEDVGMDDDLYGDAEHDVSPQDASKAQEQPATEADDEYAKTFDSPTSEEMERLDEQGSEARRGGPAGATDTGTVERRNVSSVQSSTGASGSTQPSPAPDASTTAAADITTPHASTVPSLSSADIPPSHPSLPAKPDAEDTTPVDDEPSKGAHPAPSNDPSSQQMPNSAPSPRTDGSNASGSHLPAALTGQPTVGQVSQNNPEPSSLPHPPSNPTPNGRQILPPASADLPSRPPVDMNRMRDPAKAATRHGAPKPLSKGNGQAPGVGPVFASAPGLSQAPAPGMTESLSALGPPPGPSNPSLPAPPTMPATASGPPLHYPARPGGKDGHRSDYQSKWDAYQADEKRYTIEQKWDRFPEGSRVFVGM